MHLANNMKNALNIRWKIVEIGYALIGYIRRELLLLFACFLHDIIIITNREAS